MKSRWLITGGAGYIGSSVAAELIQGGYNVTILDDMSTGSLQNIPSEINIILGDIRDQALLSKALVGVEGVVHLAGYKFASESLKNPELAYSINVGGTTALLSEMRKAGVSKMIFASTCAVYGNPNKLPVTEESILAPETPYAESKLRAEELILSEIWLDSIIFRYFNVAGSGFTGALDQSPYGLFANIMTNYLVGSPATIMGQDFATEDGTSIRDYIHVRDVSRAHLLAVNALLSDLHPREILNLCAGVGTSVRQVMQLFAEKTNCRFEYKFGERRQGDTASVFGSFCKASNYLRWSPALGVDDIVDSTLRDWKA